MERVLSDNLEVLLTGDFNYDFKTSKPSSETKKIKALFRCLQLIQIIQSPTRVTDESSTLIVIDLMITNAPYNIVKQDVFALGLSDHDLIMCVRKINTNRFARKIINPETTGNTQQKILIQI